MNAELKPSPLDAAKEALAVAGWTCNGKSPPRYHMYRGTVERIAPTGRVRFQKGDRRCTVGKRTVCFYRVVNGEATGFLNVPTADTAAVVRAIQNDRTERPEAK